MTNEVYDENHTEIQDSTNLVASFSKNGLVVIDPSDAPISNKIETISNNFCHDTKKHMLFKGLQY